MKKILLLGAGGGIGSAIHQTLAKDHVVVTLGRDDLDLNSDGSDQSLQKFLIRANPDVVINAAGVMGTNQDRHQKVMNVNFGSNWAIIQHYQNCCETLAKPVKIIIIGSSAHRSGKKEYMLYSASKAAVYNLCQAARDLFHETMVSVDIINPVKTRTAMAPGVPQPGWLLPEDVAHEIQSRLETDTSECIDMKYKD